MEILCAIKMTDIFEVLNQLWKSSLCHNYWLKMMKINPVKHCTQPQMGIVQTNLIPVTFLKRHITLWVGVLGKLWICFVSMRSIKITFMSKECAQT